MTPGAPDGRLVEALVQRPLCRRQSCVSLGLVADAFALRGYDSVQLAAAHTLQLQGAPGIVFAAFDERIANAASLIGLDSPFMKSR